MVSTFDCGLAGLFFALITSYPVEIILLLLGAVAANLASMAISQTVVRLLAPAPIEAG